MDGKVNMVVQRGFVWDGERVTRGLLPCYGSMSYHANCHAIRRAFDMVLGVGLEISPDGQSQVSWRITMLSVVDKASRLMV